MGKSTISMAIFNSYVKLPEGILSYKDGAFPSDGLMAHFSLSTRAPVKPRSQQLPHLRTPPTKTR